MLFETKYSGYYFKCDSLKKSIYEYNLIEYIAIVY